MRENMQAKCIHDIRPARKDLTRFRCNKCQKWWNEKNVPDARYNKKASPKILTAPKVLLYDTENAPNIGSVWRVWQQNIQPVQLLSDWYMLSWSAKWLNDSTIMGDVVTPKESVKEDDKRISHSLHKLINEADIIIAHNTAFDIPIMNTRFLMNDIMPPSPYQQICTLQTARRQFAFAHNKLDFLADRLGVPHKKLETSHQLWLDCRNGDQEALTNMLEYNKMDVTVLEEVYLKIRGWVKNHPNFNLYADKEGMFCSTCLSENLVENGHYSTTVNRYPSYQCQDCGAFSRVKKSKKKVSMRSIAR
jgi:transposase-like protein